jgi:hypothetical protein
MISDGLVVVHETAELHGALELLSPSWEVIHEVCVCQNGGTQSHVRQVY